MIASWPQRDETPLARDAAAEAEFSSVQALVRAIRNARADYRVAPGKQIGASIVATPALAAALRTEAPVIAGLARVATDSFGVVDAADAGGVAAEEKAAAGGQAVKLVVEEGLEAYLPLAELVDAEKERARLSKQARGELRTGCGRGSVAGEMACRPRDAICPILNQAAKLEKEIGGLEGRLASPGFVDKAPPPVVAKVRDRSGPASEPAFESKSASRNPYTTGARRAARAEGAARRGAALARAAPRVRDTAYRCR